MVANLPYSIATPLIAQCLLETWERRARLASLTFTVQREVADRMIAAPGTSDYGPISVLVALLTRAEPGPALPSPSVLAATQSRQPHAPPGLRPPGGRPRERRRLPVGRPGAIVRPASQANPHGCQAARRGDPLRAVHCGHRVGGHRPPRPRRGPGGRAVPRPGQRPGRVNREAIARSRRDTDPTPRTARRWLRRGWRRRASPV